MFKINDNERAEILAAHLKLKAQLKEQTQTPGEVNYTAEQLGNLIITNRLCFCKPEVSTCEGPLNNNGVFSVVATMAQNSQQKKSNGEPLFKVGDKLNFNLNDYTYTVPGMSVKHVWGCKTLLPNLKEMKDSLLSDYIKRGYKTIMQLSPMDQGNPSDKYEEIDLSKKYPFLYPAWDQLSKDSRFKFIYTPKNQTLNGQNASIPRNDAERKHIEAYKEQNSAINYVTLEEIINEYGSFDVVKDLYTAHQIGRVGDNIFNRPFYLYYKNTGEKEAGLNQYATHKALKDINISKSLCAKKIKTLYDMYKVNMTNVSSSTFDTLKTQVTYCARKYDNYDVLGVGKTDDKLYELTSLSSSNKFKINLR